MNVLILGYGNVGKVLTRLLVKQEEVNELICCDISVKEEKKEGKISFKKINASNKKELIELLEKVKPDVLVNLLVPDFNNVVLECCLLTKTNYIDTASFWDFDQSPNSKSPYKVEQLEFHEGFKQNGIKGLVNAGASPGLTNLLAKEASDKLDNVNNIKIRIIEDTRSDKLYLPWCVEWLLDEINWEPLIFRNGKFKLVKRFSELEKFDFYEPFGKKKICLISQEEVGTIPLYIKVRNVDIKAYDSQSELAQFLIKLGLVSDKEIEIGDIKISPRIFLSRLLQQDKKTIPEKWHIANAQFGLTVIAEGKRNKKKKTVRYSVVFPKEKDIDKLELEANFISYPTALMLKLFVMALSQIKDFGVFPPEGLNKEIREIILKNLEKAKIKINSY